MLGDAMNLIPHQTSPSAIEPTYVRLPAKSKRCPFTGLSRTTMFELCAPCAANDFRPPVRSSVIKKRFAQRGIRLVDYKSLIAHLGGLAEGK
jgi:hypothetical protein